MSLQQQSAAACPVCAATAFDSEGRSINLRVLALRSDTGLIVYLLSIYGWECC